MPLAPYCGPPPLVMLSLQGTNLVFSMDENTMDHI